MVVAFNKSATMTIYFEGYRKMKLINDKEDPDLLAILDSAEEFSEIRSQVEKMNQDLIDSGFNQYQYKAEKRGNKAYIRLK